MNSTMRLNFKVAFVKKKSTHDSHKQCIESTKKTMDAIRAIQTIT